jgi:hypothetical protein
MASRWSNAVNATYWSLAWDTSWWYLTSMASGEPMPTMITYGEAVATVTHRLPMVERLAKSAQTGLWNLGVGEGAVRRQAALHGDDRADEARRKLLEASVAVLRDAGEHLDTAGDSFDRPPAARRAAFEALVPGVVKKLVWK